MGMDLKAENLAISVPSNDCNKNCPYCISKMTPAINPNVSLMSRNLEKVKHMADLAEVTSVLITGKGEPTLNMPNLYWLIEHFKNFPVELQTNGLVLLEGVKNRAKGGPSMFDYVRRLHHFGLDVLAVSMDNLKQFVEFKPLFETALKEGLVVRATFNVSNLLGDPSKFFEVISYCKIIGVQQLTIRRVTVPVFPMNQTVVDWIRENASDDLWMSWVNQINQELEVNGRLLRQLNHGVTVWDYEGISLTWSDYCIQEQTKGTNVRSLIFQGDGHLYTSWNSKASIIF
jgi:hypothetical protein